MTLPEIPGPDVPYAEAERIMAERGLAHLLGQRRATRQPRPCTEEEVMSEDTHGNGEAECAECRQHGPCICGRRRDDGHTHPLHELVQVVGHMGDRDALPEGRDLSATVSLERPKP